MSKEAIDNVMSKGIDSCVIEQITSGEHDSTTSFRQYPTLVEVISYDLVTEMEVGNDEVIY